MLNQIKRNPLFSQIIFTQLLFSLATADLQPTRAVLALDRAGGHRQQLHDDLFITRRPGPDHLRIPNDIIGHTTPSPSLVPQSGQSSLSKAQFAPLDDHRWFLLSSAHNPESLLVDTPASQSNQLADHQQFFPRGSEFTHSPNELRLEDYLESGLVDFSTPDNEQSYLNNHPYLPPGLQNLPTVTTASGLQNSHPHDWLIRPSPGDSPRRLLANIPVLEFNQLPQSFGGPTITSPFNELRVENDRQSNLVQFAGVDNEQSRFEDLSTRPPTLEHLATATTVSTVKNPAGLHPRPVSFTKEHVSVSGRMGTRVEESASDRLSHKRELLARPNSSNSRPLQQPSKKRKQSSNANQEGQGLNQTPEIVQMSTEDHRPGPINRLDMFSLELKSYAMIHSLTWPGLPKWGSGKLFQRNVLHCSQFWKNLNANSQSSKLPLIQHAIAVGNTSQDAVLQRFRILLEEIFFRDGQFLLAFSHHREDLPSKSGILEMRSAEQENLLLWLVNIFHTDMGARPVQSEKLRVKYEHSLKSLHQLLLDYLTCQAFESQLMIWRETISRRDETKLCRLSLGDAMQTQVAINTLGIYYKYKNPPKWQRFFPSDRYFSAIFAWLKYAENSTDQSLIVMPRLVQWEGSGVLPWGNAQKFRHDMEQELRKEEKVIRLFHQRTWKFHWERLSKFAVQNELESTYTRRPMFTFPDVFSDDSMPHVQTPQIQ